METRPLRRSFWNRAGLLAILSIPLCASIPALGKKPPPPPPRPPLRSSLQPTLTISAEPLGFAAPGEFYLGARQSLVSLDFVDENRLLFTFRVPGLIRRDETAAANGEDERRIRAVVLRLPQGNVESEAVWTVHDRERYIYMLGDGQYLFRDRDTLSLGDASLQLKPFLRFPGSVLWVELDPSGHYLVAISHEPAAQKTREGDVGSSETARAQVTDDSPADAQTSDLVLRILRRDTGQVMLVSHIRDAIRLPINGDGYLGTLRAQGMAWKLNLNFFDGGSRIVGSVDSVCAPVLDFLSSREIVATTCGKEGEPRLVALSMSGRHLWETPPNIPAVWPLLVKSSSGLRMAWESLLADHAVNTAAPLGSDDIKGQDVQVMDAATGKMVLRAAASPIFDAGGNVAISPSGRRVAIVMDGNIQVFDLPAPPALQDTAAQKAAR
jgi:hypothetical protein